MWRAPGAVLEKRRKIEATARALGVEPIMVEIRQGGGYHAPAVEALVGRAARALR